MFPMGFGNKKDKGKKNGFFLKNGAAVLEKVISLHNGDCNPIRSYSAHELKKATGEFRWMIHEDYDYKLYKGLHEGREISVKKFEENRNATLERIANEVAIASRMSNHNNVLKLLGCCLETELPFLVYEFPTNGNLQSCIYAKNQLLQLSWERKLRIVNSDSKCSCISPPRPLKNDHPSTYKPRQYLLRQICGTFGYMAPEALVKPYDVEREENSSISIVAFGAFR
ncbi:hypothetical protein TIFTF001_005932 [Ficus carica]|uniref:Protein kinase domain-containing protein n=1 Tax=Ficus carica TaxID=3494 RepID=A0AA88DF70_FICCA|nr:hypothetical protein TIFTF001_005932 [Ficus carica]